MTSSPIKIYIAGKVSKNSHFGTHHWRDSFVAELQRLSGRKLISLDPVKLGVNQNKPDVIFGGDAYMISRCDVLVVYLSDDISVGGSQEILIAKYFGKPVIGLAPLGGKFNGSTKEYFDTVIENYKDPFVFSTCDVVCDSEAAVGKALKKLESIQPKGIEHIGELTDQFKQLHLADNDYLKQLLND